MVHLTHHDSKSAPASPTLDHFHRNQWTNSPEYAGERQSALTRLVILAGLRKTLGKLVEEEARKVPILNDILDHEVIGPEIKKGIQKGIEMGELKILRRLIKKRFGSVPNWAEERLAKLSAKELEDLSVRVLDAKSIETLLK